MYIIIKEISLIKILNTHHKNESINITLSKKHKTNF